MKTLFLTIVLMVFSISITAQDTIKVPKISSKNEKPVAQPNSPSNFTKEVQEKKRFKYREFLIKSKKSEETYQIGEKFYSKKELVEIIRKTAKKSVNQTEFNKMLTKENPQFSNYFLKEEMACLYIKFREGTLNKYVDELVNNW